MTKRHVALVAALAALPLTLAGCTGGDDDPIGGTCGDGFNAETGTVGDFGTGEAALKAEAFLQATADLYGASTDVQAELLAACTAMAADLGISSSELEPSGAELEVTAACGRVATEIESILQTDLPVGGALAVSVTPAECMVDLDVAAQCAGECDVDIEGSAMVECNGELYGSCEGSCSGECVVEGSADCQGECSATCSGSCSGTCNGQCDGTCTLEDEQGNCIGTCTGTCEGACEGTCEGSCSGSCTADVEGSCSGECRGSCDVAWEAQCNGEADVQANADCEAACETRANANASCTEPTVTVVGVVVADPDAQQRLDALVATLEANLPALFRVQARLQYALIPSLDAFVSATVAASTSLASVGVQGAACLGVAADAAAEAAAGIEASFEVSVEVSASVSAEGSAG